eukprot:131034_1
MMKKKTKTAIPTRNQLMRLSKQDLIKKCRKYKIKFDANSKNETINRLLKAIKKQRKVKLTKKEKKKKKAKNKRKSDISLSFSLSMDLEAIASTVLDAIPMDNIDNNDGDVIYSNNTKRTHQKRVRRTSLISISVKAPNMTYELDLRAWNTIREIKQQLPMQVEPGQCKIFFGGRELNDDQTLSQIGVEYGYQLMILLSWRYFEPDPSAQDPKEIEHSHVNKVAE